MKKISILCLVIVVVLTSCNSNPPEHKHTWSKEYVVTEATCSAPGKAYAYCLECGDGKLTEIPVDGNNHSYNDGEVSERQSKALTPSAFDRLLTCKNCSHEHRNAIPETSVFQGPSIKIIVPYSAGGTSDNLTEAIIGIANSFIGDDDAIIKENLGGKNGKDGVGAAERFADKVSTTNEIFLAPYNVWYKDAMGDLDFALDASVVPVISVANTPAALFVKDGAFSSLEDFLLAGKNKAMKIGCPTNGGKQYAIANLLGQSGVSFEIVDLGNANESGFDELLSGAVDAVVTLAFGWDAHVNAKEVFPLTMLSKEDYVVVCDDGRMVPVPSVVDFGYSDAAIDLGYFFAVGADAESDYVLELAELVADALLTETVQGTLSGYNYTLGNYMGESLKVLIEENKAKVTKAKTYLSK